ncbi:MAG TPA: gamma-glutamylcyclotransferase family protein [Candidatus Binataceae bacterium]|nr:gamma-glutamylcyclotransferase family protein [Candidatus Binataceae bacterium]
MSLAQLPLFVYGSLIDPQRRAEVIGREIDAMPARLNGYERGRGRYWFIRQRAGRAATGAILENLTDAEFVRLDEYEEVPVLYTRERVRVSLIDGDAQRECWVYLPTGWEQN